MSPCKSTLFDANFPFIGNTKESNPHGCIINVRWHIDCPQVPRRINLPGTLKAAERGVNHIPRVFIFDDDTDR